MPVITIQESVGRTSEQRRKLVAGITDAFREAYGLDPSAVTIFFQSYRADEWGKDGKLHVDRAPAKEASTSTSRPLGAAAGQT
jgi:4-oxalocrotonate tautomerase